MWHVFVAIALLTVLALVTDRRFLSPVLVGYAIRVTMAYVHAYVLALPDSQFDAIRFEQVAWMWARDGECIEDFTTGSLLYSWIGSCVYVVVGRSALVLQLLNAFVGALIVVVAAKTTELLASRGRYAVFVGWALALHPSLILYSAITMREVAVVFCFVVSVHWLTKWAVERSYRYAVWAILWVVISQLFHTGMVAATVMVVGVVMYITVSEHWRRIGRIHIEVRDARIAVASLMVIGGLAGVGALAILKGYGLDKLQRLTEVGANFVDVLGQWQKHVARGRASYLDSLQPDSWIDVVVQTPVRLVYFLGAPFAWMVDGIGDVWGLLDGTFLMVLCGLLVVHSIRGGVWRKREYWTVAMVVVVGIVGFAVVTSNYGTAFRHRAKFVSTLFVLYAWAMSHRRSRRIRGEVGGRYASDQCDG